MVSKPTPVASMVSAPSTSAMTTASSGTTTTILLEVEAPATARRGRASRRRRSASVSATVSLGFDATPAMARPTSLTVAAAAVNSATMRPRYMTRMRSDSDSTSSSSVETMRMPSPSSRALAKRSWMYSIEPTSMPRVGCAAISNWCRAHLAGDDQLLLVAAGEDCRRGSKIDGGADVEVADDPRPRLAVDRVPVHADAVGEGRRVVAVEHGVLGDAEVLDHAGALAVLGDVGDARRWRSRALARVMSLRRRKVTVPAGDAAQAGERLDQLGLAVALDPGDADDLAGADVKSTPATATSSRSLSTVRSLTSRRTGPGARSSLLDGEATARPTIISARSALVAVFGSPSPTTRPARSTVMRSATSSTSCSLWVMKTIALPASRSERTMLEEVADLLRGEHRGRLVEDDGVGRAEEDLDDLDALLEADRELLDQRVGVDLEAVARRDRADLARAPS